MYQDYKDLLSAFQSRGVRYLVVGGFAVIYHSQSRFTKEYPPGGIHGPQHLFRFGRDPKGFDILPAIPGVDFDAAWERRVETVIDTATA